MNKLITIYTTHPDFKSAKDLCNKLLQEKLIACVNYFPIEVSYHWKWEIANAQEYVWLLKTRQENWEIIKEIILKNHPYEVPCIIKTEVEANEDYVRWIYNETNKQTYPLTNTLWHLNL